MKKINLSVIALLFTVVIVSPLTVYGQTPVMPNFSSWKKLDSNKYAHSIGGKKVNLLEEVYQNTDLQKLKRDSVVLVYNEANNLWLGIYTNETGGKLPDGSISTKEFHVYLFESIKGKWVFIKDVTSMSQAEFNKFLFEKYNLQ